MKPIQWLRPFALLVVVLAVWGCTKKKNEDKDKCKGVVCDNGGVCVEGSCSCPTGYEGLHCETITRTALIGNWYVWEDGSLTDPAQYPVSMEVAAGGTSNDLIIRNFNNYLLSPVNAKLVNDTVFISEQRLQGKIVTGKGRIHNDTILMMYKVTDSASGMVNDFGYNAPPTMNMRSVWSK